MFVVVLVKVHLIEGRIHLRRICSHFAGPGYTGVDDIILIHRV